MPDNNSDGSFYINIHTHNADYEARVLSIFNLYPENVELLNSDSHKSKFSIGLHPWFINPSSANKMMDIINNNIENKNVLAIGEVGLDRICNIDYNLQLEFFSLQLEIAERVQKPVIIHAVRSYSDILKLKKSLNPTVPWILHGYNGNTESTQQLINKGIYFSFGNYIGKNPKTSEVLKLIPDELLFLENDDSDIPIENIYEKAAKIRSQKIELVRKNIQTNFASLFGNINYE